MVGDDAQSIYAFRGANVRNILDYPAQFSPAAEIITLERNYRSTQAILAAANGVIGLAKERFTKNLWSDRDAGTRPLLVNVRDEAGQANYIVERILENAEAPAPARAGDTWDGFVKTVQSLRAGRSGWPAEMGQARLWYEPHLERMHEDAMLRRADLLQLEQIAAGYPSRERFLTELTLDPPEATSDQAGVPFLDEDYLNLTTIHSAKGQEFKSVFVLNVVDGCMPSDLGTGQTHEIEEERRLLHVAMTRAKDELHLMLPQRFFTHGQNRLGDRHVYAARSRFIPDELLNLFQNIAWPIAGLDDDVRTPTGQAPRIDVAAKMRGMWGNKDIANV